MKLKNIRNLSVPIAIAKYQQITLKGNAVITSISICCFTNTVDRIIRKESNITDILIDRGRPSASIAASIKSIDKEQ